MSSTPPMLPAPSKPVVVADELPGASTAPKVPARKPVIVVDELADREVIVRHTTVNFRPGQIVSDPYLINLARENNVFLRERL